MIFGAFITAFAVNMLIIPSGILSGGLTGTSLLLHHFIPINVGYFYFGLNIPLLIIAYKFLGNKFIFYTIVSTTLLSAFLFIIPIEPIWTENTLLAAIFGGGLTGLGNGLALRTGGSQGGFDILSRAIAKRKNITVGKMSMIINMCIVILSGFIFGSEIALFTILSILSSMKLYELVLDHVNRISVLIITEKGEEVNDTINKELYRGTTMWDANGGYTHDNKIVLFCVTAKGESRQLKQIVKSVDKKAFVSIISTDNVIGKFHSIW
nr:YitT family protein [Aquibacillus sediminis]